MMVDFLYSDTSLVNVFFTIITPMLFCVALVVYAYIRHYYSDKIRSFIDMLLFSLIFMTLAMVFRFYGDGMIADATTEYAFQWVQSGAMVLSAVFFALGAYKFTTLFGGDE